MFVYFEELMLLFDSQSKQNALALQWSGDTLACCWSNGRIDWREGTTGRVLRRVQMRAGAAAMLLADYRSVGAPDLVCVSDRGEGKIVSSFIVSKHTYQFYRARRTKN